MKKHKKMKNRNMWNKKKEEVKKKKKWPDDFRQTVIQSRLRTVEKWQNRKNETSLREWCEKERICRRTMNNWIKNYPKYKNLSFAHKSRIRRRYKQKGKYHEQEVKLNQRFAERRAKNHRVTGRWIKSTMKHIIREDLPDLDTSNKFKDKWLQGFCKRFRISWQRRTNKKNKGVFQRLHIAKNYHWWVIYKLGSLRPHSMKIEETKKISMEETIKKNQKKQKSEIKKKKKLNKEDKPLFVRAPPLPKLISKKKK